MAAINYLVEKIGNRPPLVKEMIASSYITCANYSAILDITPRALTLEAAILSHLGFVLRVKKEQAEMVRCARFRIWNNPLHLSDGDSFHQLIHVTTSFALRY